MKSPSSRSPLAPTCFDLVTAYAFTFVIPAIPKSQPRARHMAGISKAGKLYSRTYNPDTNKAFKAAVYLAAAAVRDSHIIKQRGDVVKPWDQAIRVDIDAFFPAPDWLSRVHRAEPVPMLERPDRDNLDKCVLDALTVTQDQPRGLWVDDALVCQGEVRKWYAATGKGPGLRVAVEFLLLPTWYQDIRRAHLASLASAKAKREAAKRPAHESHIATEIYEADALPGLARQMRKRGRR